MFIVSLIYLMQYRKLVSDSRIIRPLFTDGIETGSVKIWSCSAYCYFMNYEVLTFQCPEFLSGITEFLVHGVRRQKNFMKMKLWALSISIQYCCISSLKMRKERNVFSFIWKRSSVSVSSYDKFMTTHKVT